MSKEENIRAILETNFAGFKEELIDSAVNRLMEVTDSGPMIRYLDADKLEKDGWTMQRIRQDSPTETVCETRKPTDFPASDVVAQSTVDQIRWERDLALSQLEQIGKGLGSKMDDVVEMRHGRWIDAEPAPFGQMYETCSECGTRQTLDKGKDRFCGVCGAKMDEVE